MNFSLRGAILAGFLLLAIRPGSAVTPEQLRAALTRDAGAPPGEQYIHIGPLKDGRHLYVTSRIVNGSSDVRVEPTGRDRFLIRMGRTLAIHGVFLSDAMIVCARAPKPACDLMADYIELVRKAPSPSRAPFIEEAFPELHDAARAARADDALYAASLQAGIETLMGAATLHEIGHAALRHLDVAKPDPVTEIAQEAEADGFASFLAEAGGIPTSGLAAPFLLDFVKEHVTGESPVRHPPPICRLRVLGDNVIAWLRGHEAELLAPGDNAARDQVARELFDGLAAREALAGLDDATVRACHAYIVSFGLGAARARALIDPNTTEIESTTAGQN